MTQMTEDEQERFQQERREMMEDPTPDKIRSWAKKYAPRMAKLHDEALMGAIMKLRLKQGIKEEESSQWLFDHGLTPLGTIEYQ